MATKICSMCGQEKPLDEFYKLPKGKPGYRAACKVCTRKRNSQSSRKSLLTSPEKARARMNAYRARNKKKFYAAKKLRDKRYRDKHPEKVKEWSQRARKKFKLNHPKAKP